MLAFGLAAQHQEMSTAAGPGCGTVHSWSRSVRHVRALRVRLTGESLPCDEPPRVGNRLDPLADLFR
jgi:hypothetical protein